MSDGKGGVQVAAAISAVLASIDGTLVTKDQVLTEGTIHAVNRLRERGVVFTICSGRSPRGMRMMVEPLRLTMPMAAFNGGVIVLPDLSVLDERAIPDYVVPAIVEVILTHDLDVWIYTATDWYLRSREAPRVDREASTSQVAPTVLASLDAVVGGVVKIVGVSDDHDRVAECEAALQQEFGTQVSAARSEPYHVDVTHTGANKGAVTERLARYLKIPAEALATIGGRSADVPMFRQSGMSIAMGDANEVVRRQATHVTTSSEDEGFANAVDQFILPRAEPARADVLRATGQLHRMGQSLWLDHITRDLLTSGTLKQYIQRASVTGLTSNAAVYEQAIRNSSAYDAAISNRLAQGKSSEALFFEFALDDLRRAADLFRPINDRTDGIDGWVSLEVSPALAHDTAGTIAAAKSLFSGRGGRSNLMINIPGTREGLPAIEEAIFAGIPINVTLLFSREHYFAAAEAFLRGIERRIQAGLKPDVASVASVSISRWDSAVADAVPDGLRGPLGPLGIAIAKRTYKAYRSLLSSSRWQRAYNAGARPQRLLWASTGGADPTGSDVPYVRALAAPFTVTTIPEATLKALAEDGELTGILPADGGDCEEILARFASAGVNVKALAAQLQADGATSIGKSWQSLMDVIASKRAALTS